MSGKKEYHEPEIIDIVKLCDSRGRLNPDAVGWSRYPLHNCNLSKNFMRKKRWNYWCIVTDRFLFSATLSDIDYLGLAFIYFLDFKTRYFHEVTVTRPLGKGCSLPDKVSGSIYFEDEKLKLSFVDRDDKTCIKVNCPDFDGKELNVDLAAVLPEGHETLNVVIPWSDRKFQFTSKQHSLPAEGEITLGDDSYNAEGGFACLDFGRGVWPYASMWNWAGGTGISKGHTIGLNFGAGWTDGTGMNENGICINGRLAKISEDLIFTYDRKDFMKPWKIKTAVTDRIDVKFEPFYERLAKTNAIILASEVHQMIGYFSGTITDEEGNRYSFEKFPGWAEEHRARW